MKTVAALACLALLACGGSPGGVDSFTAEQAADAAAGPDAAADGAPAPATTGDAAPSSPAADTGPVTPPCSGPAIWFPDADGDGYGAKGSVARAVCGDTAGYAQNDLDCGDGDDRMHPGQTLAFSTAAKGLTTGEVFDFDCDGVAKRTWTGAGVCYYSSAHPCSAGNTGWQEKEAECGKTTQWITSCSPQSSSTCNGTYELRTQTCR